QARMGSTRLPGKVMMPIKGKPLLYYVINQIKHSKTIPNHIIATTKLQQDDVIANYAKTQNVLVFRGNQEDVLDRYYQCAKQYGIDTIVRISADSPLIDFEIIDLCVNKFRKNGFDYLGNTIEKINDVWKETYNGFPIGFAVEVFTFEALESAWRNAKKPSDREHVTEYIWQNPQIFKLGNITNTENLSNIRLVVDYKSDFELIKKIIEQFEDNEIFTTHKVIELINKNPKLFDKSSK
ncbi:MAG: glycosyltransferase family protein, partial [Candidatus Nitrosotenuis sp.]